MSVGGIRKLGSRWLFEVWKPFRTVIIIRWRRYSIDDVEMEAKKKENKKDLRFKLAVLGAGANDKARGWLQRKAAIPGCNPSSSPESSSQSQSPPPPKGEVVTCGDGMEIKTGRVCACECVFVCLGTEKKQYMLKLKSFPPRVSEYI